MKLCFATQNRNKLKEIQQLMPPGIELIVPEDLGCKEELPETQATLEGNSNQKAEYIYHNYQANCFADDTGLEINALGGEPGVFSARYAGPQKNAEDNMKLVLEKLTSKSDRTAQFRTIITLILEGRKEVFEGILKGKIIDKPIGSHGFGYDPIFIPEGESRTLAEMSLEEKGTISHRGKAFAKLKSYLASKY